MRYNIRWKNGQNGTFELTESAFDRLMAEQFDNIDLITEDDYAEEDENIEIEEAEGYDYYGPKEMADEDEGTFRIKYYGGPGHVEYLAKSRNNKYHWKDETHFNYDTDKPFETDDYQLALQLVDKMGGEIENIKVEDDYDEENETIDEKLDNDVYKDGDEEIEIEKAPNGKYFNKYNIKTSPSTAGYFSSKEEAEQALKKHRPNSKKVDEATEVEPDMFDAEFDKTYVDGRETVNFYDVYTAMSEIAPDMSYTGDNYDGKELNLIYYPKGSLSNEEFQNIKSEFKNKFGNAVRVRSASSEFAPEQRKIYIGFLENSDDNDDLDEGIKDNFKKAGNFVKNTIAAGAIAGGLMGNPADAKGQEMEQPIAIEQALDGTIIDQYGNKYTVSQWEALENGEDPFTDGATQPESLDEDVDDTNDKVKVFFVKEQNPYNEEDEITAVFPDLIDDRTSDVTVYSHIGQHSVGDLNYVKTLTKATPEEYADLLAELKRIGYNIDLTSDIEEDEKVRNVSEEYEPQLDDDAVLQARINDIKHIMKRIKTINDTNEKRELLRDLEFTKKEFKRLYPEHSDLFESDMPINDVTVGKEVLSLAPSTKGWEALDLTGIMSKIEKAESPLSNDSTNDSTNDDLDDAKMNDTDNKPEKANMDIKGNSDKEEPKKEIKETFIIH